MIFHVLVTVFFFVYALLLGLLSVMRGLYAFSTFQAPCISSDSAAKISLENGHEQPNLSWSSGEITPDLDPDQRHVEEVDARRIEAAVLSSRGIRAADEGNDSFPHRARAIASDGECGTNDSSPVIHRWIVPHINRRGFQ